MRGPADQPGRGQFFEPVDLQLRERLDMLLLRVRRNDFEVASLTQREQSVVRPAARMNTAKCGTDAGMLLNEVYTAIEIVTAEQDMIEQRRNLSGGPC